jgi:hypothetical protein
MLAGFGLYREPHGYPLGDHHTIGMPLGTRLQRLIRLPHGWRLWVSTKDFRYGTYLELHDSGRIVKFTSREGEGDEFFQVRPSDEELRM